MDSNQPGTWLRLLVQRPALALLRHHPDHARAGRGASPRSPLDGGERQGGVAPRTHHPARRYNIALQCLFRQGARHLRSARTRGARVRVQYERRQLPLPQLAAGLLALHHLDARSRMGAVRLPGAVGISRDFARRRFRSLRRQGSGAGAFLGNGEGRGGFLSRAHAD